MTKIAKALILTAIIAAGCVNDKQTACKVDETNDVSSIKTIPVTKVTEWTDRVIPLPKKMAIRKKVVVSPWKVSYTISDYKGASKKTAIRYLNSFAKGKRNQNCDVVINLKIAQKGITPSEINNTLASLKNKEQAYIIKSEVGKNGLTINIFAKTAVGLFYGAQTLTQLVKPSKDLTPGVTIEIPVVDITDWPDMEERGTWGGQEFSIKDFQWYSTFKINEVHPTSVNFRPRLDAKTGKPVLQMANKNIVKDGAEYGIKVLLSIAHLDSLSMNSGINMALTNKKLAYWKPACKVPPPGVKKKPYGICPSNKVFKELLENWLRQIVKLTYPYHREVYIWISEGNHPCYCPECKGKDVYTTEVNTLIGVLRKLQKDYPELRLRIMYSQGLYPKDQKDIDIIPEDVGLVYYSGHGTYVTDRKPMIYPLIEKFAKAGKFLGVVPQFSHDIRTFVPFTCPQFIKFRMNEFVDKKLSTVDSFNVPSRHFYEFNIAAEGEWGWNAKGRSCAEFARAYATVTGLCQPELFADWAVKIGEANYDLAETRMFCRLTENSLLGMDKSYAWDFYFRHATIVKKPDKLKKSIILAGEALKLAEKSGNAQMVEESRFTLSGLEAFKDLWTISDIIKGKGITKENRQTFITALENLKKNAVIICGNVKAWEQWATENSKNAGVKKRPPGYGARSRQPVVGLLAITEFIQKYADRHGIVDNYPQIRSMDIGEWNCTDFKKGKANLKFDITNLISPEGGTYLINTYRLDGYMASVKSFTITTINNKGVKKIHNPFLPPFERAIKNCFNLPPREKGIKYVLDINLTVSTPGGNYLQFPEGFPQDKQLCDGLITMRRIWNKGEKPKACSSTTKVPNGTRIGKKAVQNILSAVPARVKNKIMVGVIKGMGAETIINNLNKEKDMKAYQLIRLDPEILKKCDVIIVTRKDYKTSPVRINRAINDLRLWVKDGGGLLCLHDGVGGLGGQSPVFGEFGCISGSEQGGDAEVINSRHPVMKNFTKGEIIKLNKSFKTRFLSDSDKRIALIKRVFKNKKVAVVAAAEYGKGKVVLDGIYTAANLNDIKDPAILRIEKNQYQILVNAIRWLGEK